MQSRKMSKKAEEKERGKGRGYKEVREVEEEVMNKEVKRRKMSNSRRRRGQRRRQGRRRRKRKRRRGK